MIYLITMIFFAIPAHHAPSHIMLTNQNFIFFVMMTFCSLVKITTTHTHIDTHEYIKEN